MKWFDLVLKFLPTIISLVEPGLTEIAAGIAATVNEAEQIWGPTTGPQKLQHVINASKDLAATVNLTQGHTVIDPAGLAQAVSDGLKTGIEIVNLIAAQVNTA